MNEPVRMSPRPYTVKVSTPDESRFLSRGDCEEIARRVQRFADAKGKFGIMVQSGRLDNVRWGRNRVMVSADVLENTIELTSYEDTITNGATVQLNQVDDASLRAAVQGAERLRANSAWIKKPQRLLGLIDVPRPTPSYQKTPIWSEPTYAQTPDARHVIACTLIDSAERAGMVSAGYLSVKAIGHSVRTPDGIFLYEPQTLAECSLTVRDPAGKGSGWAGASSYDWARFNPQQLAEKALDKCLRSRNPVVIEPGRYTLILEPQAAYELVRTMIFPPWNPGTKEIQRSVGEAPLLGSPYFDRQEVLQVDHIRNGLIGMSKLGQRLIDSRISISHDPMDPDLGIVPFNRNAELYQPVTWVDQGVLVSLETDVQYAREKQHLSEYHLNSGSFRMSGGTTSIEEMIATTKRGLIVTRFWNMALIDPHSVLCTGVTRDGLWLIENGKISKPVKNMFFTESPFFALNSVEALGVPVPVYSPRFPAVVPPLKVRDFSFTSLSDAV